MCIACHQVHAAELTNVLNNVSVSATGELKAVVDNYNSAISEDDKEGVLSAAKSVTDNGAVMASLSALQGASNIVHNRLTQVRTRLAESSGLSAGSFAEDMNFWVKPYGQLASLNTDKNMTGYNVDSFGLSIGVDTQSFIKDTTIGIAISYSESEVSSKDINQTETDVDTFQIGIYADKSLENNASLVGYIGYGHSENGSVRHNVGGVSNLVAEGNFESHQFILQGQVSKRFYFKDVNLTPTFFSQYMMYDPDTYKEEGAGTANLSVDYDTYNKLDIGVALELDWTKLTKDQAVFSPFVRVSYMYDLIADQIEGTNIFTGGGQRFGIKGEEPSDHNFGVGLGINYENKDSWDFGVNYDFTFSSDYKSHFGYLLAKTAL
jgi:outer membrane autotransporter protein